MFWGVGSDDVKPFSTHWNSTSGTLKREIGILQVFKATVKLDRNERSWFRRGDPEDPTTHSKTGLSEWLGVGDCKSELQ